MNDPLQPGTNTQVTTEEQSLSTVTWMMRGMCVVIVDRVDGATIMLEPEEAEALRQWLAETI